MPLGVRMKRCAAELQIPPQLSPSLNTGLCSYGVQLSPSSLWKMCMVKPESSEVFLV